MNNLKLEKEMSEYFLYVDQSRESEQVEQELEQKGIRFIRVLREPGGRILPTLACPEGVFEGTANIKLYFLARRRGHVRA